MTSDNQRPMSSSGVSQNSGMSKKKSRKAKTPYSLEEIFNQLSEVTSSGLNPPPCRILLTPRSAQVVLEEGVNPEVLKIRDIDSFYEPGIDPAVQRMRHEAYVQRRHETMKRCRGAKKKMQIAEFEASTNINKTETMTPEMILEQQREAGSSLIQMEMARIKKMQQRQAKELEKMMEGEVQRAKTQADMQKRLDEAKRKEELRKKQREKRMKLMAEERRLKEMQKIAMEEAEEAKKLELAKVMHIKEQKLINDRLKKEKEDRIRARELDKEKREKQEHHRLQVQQFFDEEQATLRKRLETLHLAEEKKQAAIIERQTRLAEELQERRAMIDKRIAANMEMAKMIEEKKKQNFLDKQAYHDKMRNDMLQQQEKERYLRSQEIELQEQRRQMILLQSRKEEEMKAEHMLQKFDEEEYHIEEVQKSRKKNHDIQKERNNLRKQLKAENVQRVKRVAEYKRMGILKKIEDTDCRMKTMSDQRMSLLQERRKASRDTKLQKEKIAAVMDEVRTNATKANKMIKAALTGSVTLDSLIKPDTKKKKRSKSAPKNRTGMSTKTRLGSTGDSFDNNFTEEMEGNGKMYSVPQAANTAQPYKSPYDEDLVDAAATQ